MSGSARPRRFHTAAGRSARANRARGAALGVACDRILGEPALGAAHPVAVFGRAMSGLERRLRPAVPHASRCSPSRWPLAAGAALTLAGAAGATGAAVAARSTTLATYVATSGRALHEVAGEIAARLAADDLAGARAALGDLVGRDTEVLDAAGVARAAVESVAENTVDAVIAPLWWAAVLGPAGAGAHRALDTLDSMVGYRWNPYARFGTPSARADDVAAWIPARLTAVLVAAARPHRAAAVARAVRRQAPAHPSPNAGVAEAAFAAALGVTLGGPVRYGGVDDHRPLLGTGRPPHQGDITAAVALSRWVTWLAVLLTAAAATALDVRRPATQRATGAPA